VILINGKQATTIEATDRGLHYGDGLFETIEIINEQPIFLTLHLMRLEAGCSVLNIPFPKKILLIDEVNQLCNNISHGVIKIVLTRGSGGRGYRQPDLINITRYIALHPYPNYLESYKEQGILARFCATRLGLNPSLAGLKHNNRLEQVLARAEWQDEVQEGLMLNIKNEVIEGTMSNLFVVKDQKILTSKITECGVKGIMRQMIMDHSKSIPIPLKETTLNKKDIFQADELFISNSVIGIWPIRQLEGKIYPVGKITEQLMLYFDELKSQSLN
jgi:4-amino-4-deoxychorismate lyase